MLVEINIQSPNRGQSKIATCKIHCRIQLLLTQKFQCNLKSARGNELLKMHVKLQSCPYQFSQKSAGVMFFFYLSLSENSKMKRVLFFNTEGKTLFLAAAEVTAVDGTKKEPLLQTLTEPFFLSCRNQNPADFSHCRASAGPQRRGSRLFNNIQRYKCTQKWAF